MQAPYKSSEMIIWTSLGEDSNTRKLNELLINQ